MSDVVTAVWEGPFPMRLPDTHPHGGRDVEHGDEVTDIPREQAENSDYWRVLPGQAPKPPTKAELTQQAEELGLETKGLKVAEIAAAIEAHLAAEAEAEAAAAEPETPDGDTPTEGTAE